MSGIVGASSVTQPAAFAVLDVTPQNPGGGGKSSSQNTSAASVVVSLSSQAAASQASPVNLGASDPMQVDNALGLASDATWAIWVDAHTDWAAVGAKFGAAVEARDKAGQLGDTAILISAA